MEGSIFIECSSLLMQPFNQLPPQASSLYQEIMCCSVKVITTAGTDTDKQDEKHF